MSTETKNYKFVKPDLTDPADIRIINRNFDKLDDMIFRSGEIGNHLGDPNAHADIFAKYLPLEGGTLTGSVYGKYSEWSNNIKLGQDMIFSNDTSNSILNGYGQKYGAKITLYGSDITSGYTNRKCCIRLESIDKTDTNQSSNVSITPNQVVISTNNSTSKYALNVPTIGVNRIYSINNNIPVINSYNGNCTMQFMDLGNNQFIRFVVKNHAIDIRDDGVYYNDKPSIIMEEVTGDENAWYLKYSDGSLIQGGIVTNHTSTLTFPMPFKDNKYYVAVGALTNDYQYGGAVFGYTTRLTTGLDGLFCSVSNQTTSYPSWYGYGNNPSHNYVLKPHWYARGAWK